jgi:hypothetical protein
MPPSEIGAAPAGSGRGERLEENDVERIIFLFTSYSAST